MIIHIFSMSLNDGLEVNESILQATAEELRASNTLAESAGNVLRKIFSAIDTGNRDESMEDEEDESEMQSD